MMISQRPSGRTGWSGRWAAALFVSALSASLVSAQTVPDSLNLSLPLPTPPAEPSPGEAPPPTEGNDLAQHATRILAGCNYVELTSRINTLVQTFTFVQQIGNLVLTPLRGGGWPTMDLWRQGVASATQRSNERQMFASAQGMILQFEQACHVFRMAQSTAKELESLRRQNFQVRLDLKTLFRDVALEIGSVRDTIFVTYATDVLQDMPDPEGPASAESNPERHFMAAADSSAVRQLTESDRLLDRLAQLEATVLELREEHFVYASLDSAFNLTCPPEYPPLPSPIPPDRMRRRGPVCGPASPGRIAQVVAQLKAVQLELTGLNTIERASQLTQVATAAARQTIEMDYEKRSLQRFFGSFQRP